MQKIVRLSVDFSSSRTSAEHLKALGPKAAKRRKLKDNLRTLRKASEGKSVTISYADASGSGTLRGLEMPKDLRAALQAWVEQQLPE
jgi:hypothetical protein